MAPGNSAHQQDTAAKAEARAPIEKSAAFGTDKEPLPSKGLDDHSDLFCAAAPENGFTAGEQVADALSVKNINAIIDDEDLSRAQVKSPDFVAAAAKSISACAMLDN